MEPPEPSKDFMGLWIIEKESGIPIMSVSLEDNDNSIDSVLFGGFMVAIRGLMSDFEIGQLTSFTTEISNLLLTGGASLISVLAIRKNANMDSWYPVLITINNKAEDFYKSNIDNSGLLDTTMFKNLEAELKNIILEHVDKAKKLADQNQDSEAKKAKKKLEDSGLW
ncbi:MAG: hypothetical protein ACTSW1_12885 [Candidatus Hodarchaeales archaeon]